MEGEGCYVCASTSDEANILLCDGRGCDSECHFYCAGLAKVPEGRWFCITCESALNYTPSPPPSPAAGAAAAEIRRASPPSSPTRYARQPWARLGGRGGGKRGD
uniref:PHD-type domain-containing protein n=1 Tax=Phaeomonas parva TaxID=124430 RepID=A0A7S1TVM7_9STRA|mmetsp:Transcript_19830/g.60102  ORF Transcript_19830/g.60102 Transcript_19830/m.60102 type:complete len:104 (+) Transcript_19830:219-530(+)